MNKKSLIFELSSLNNCAKRLVIKKSKNIDFCPASSIQIRIINYLIKSKEDVYQKDLEKKFNLRRSTVSGILKTMEKHNIITREDSTMDARVKKIVLTEDAKNKYKKMINKFKKVDSELMNGISDSELEIFFNVIDKVKSNLENLGDEKNDKVI